MSQSIGGIHSQQPTMYISEAPAPFPGAQTGGVTLGNPMQAFGAAREAAAHAMPQTDRANVAQNTQEGILDKVSRWFSEGHKAMKGDYGLPATTTIHVNGQELNYSRAELKDMIKSLPRMERQEARENLAATLTQRVAHGETLARTVLSGGLVERCNAQNASDILLFLDAKNRSVSADGTTFSSGAFSIEDSEGRLYEYLDASDDKYLRSSSHMKADQHARITNSAGQQHENVHRGIDFKGGPQTALPNGMRTLLFAAIPANAEAGTERRIFMKAESYGCCISSLGDAQKAAGRSSVGSESRTSNGWADIKQMIGHTASFITTRFEEAGATSRKERVPTDIKDGFKALLSSPTFASVRGELAHGDPLETSNGIRSMMQNIHHALDAMPVGAQRNQAIDEIQTFLETTANTLASANHLNARIGNEAMFNEDEIRMQLGGRNQPQMLETNHEVMTTFTRAGITNNAQAEVISRREGVDRLYVAGNRTGFTSFLQTLNDSMNGVASAQQEMASLFDRYALEDDQIGALVREHLATAFEGAPEVFANDTNKNALLNISLASLPADVKRNVEASIF